MSDRHPPALSVSAAPPSRKDDFGNVSWGNIHHRRVGPLSKRNRLPNNALRGLPPHVYTQLTDASTSIRLLKITKRVGDAAFQADLIEGCIVEGSLGCRDSDGNHISYTALSYTWGNFSVGKGLIVDDRLLRIRDNVYDFLNFSNAHLVDAWLWIDAVCIDQRNMTERIQQVKLMAQIYSCASKVRVWLGAGDSTLSWLFQCIEGEPDDIQNAHAAILHYPHDSETQAKLGASFRVLKNLQYWSRMWVVQEVFFAKQIVVHYDKDTMEWEQLREAWLAWKQLADQESASKFSREGPMDNIVGIKDDFKMSSKRCMSLVLSELQRSDCTLQHDLVYAALSLIEHGEHFPIDYNSSLIELMVDTLAFIVRTESPSIDRLPLSRAISQRLLADFGLEHDEPIFAVIRQGLQRAAIPVNPELRSGHLKRKRNEGRTIWLSDRYRSPAPWVFFNVVDMDILEPADLPEMLQENHRAQFTRVYDFLQPSAMPNDGICWWPQLGVLLIVQPNYDEAPGSHDSHDTSATPQTDTYKIIGRVAFDHSIRHGGEAGHYELYTGPDGLPGVSLTIGSGSGHSKDLSRLNFIDSRAEIILFGLPEHQGVRLTAMFLMSQCGGNVDFMRTDFFIDGRPGEDGSARREHDIEVRSPSADNGQSRIHSRWIRHRTHQSLCYFGQNHSMSGGTYPGAGGWSGLAYYIDFLSEDERRTAEQHHQAIAG